MDTGSLMFIVFCCRILYKLADCKQDWNQSCFFLGFIVLKKSWNLLLSFEFWTLKFVNMISGQIKVELLLLYVFQSWVPAGKFTAPLGTDEEKSMSSITSWILLLSLSTIQTTRGSFTDLQLNRSVWVQFMVRVIYLGMWPAIQINSVWPSLRV